MPAASADANSQRTTNLGLADAIYNEVRGSVTTVIHNAWRLDFNLSLSSFEPNVQGMCSLRRTHPVGSRPGCPPDRSLRV
ncbi:hypothetical protein BDZ97DRAFT_6416 [Flammula alnicola]|nr:hypothetical protein BDZ97DRAFT_6416 [Flammula alnicola]